MRRRLGRRSGGIARQERNLRIGALASGVSSLQQRCAEDMYKNALQTSLLSFLLSSSVFNHLLLTTKHIQLDAVTSILTFFTSIISCAVPTNYSLLS